MRRAAWIGLALLSIVGLTPGAHAELPPTSPTPALQSPCPGTEESPRTKVVDLNTADESALLALPGVGPARARAILDYRAAHGGFRSVSQLLQIRGIGRALLKQLRPLVTLSEVPR